MPARKYCCGLLCGSVSQTRVTVNWLVIFPSHRAGGYGRRRCLAPCAGQDINRRGKTLKCVSAKQLPQDHEKPIRINDADVAELVDARDLKSLDGNVVRVRVPPPAPVKSDIFSHFQARELSRSVRRVSDKSATGPDMPRAAARRHRRCVITALYGLPDGAPLHWRATRRFRRGRGSDCGSDARNQNRRKADPSSYRERSREIQAAKTRVRNQRHPPQHNGQEPEEGPPRSLQGHLRRSIGRSSLSLGVEQHGHKLLVVVCLNPKIGQPRDVFSKVQTQSGRAE